MTDTQKIQAQRDGHMLVVKETSTLVRSMAGLRLGYEIDRHAYAVEACSPMALVKAARHHALMGLTGSRRRTDEIAAALDALDLSDLWETLDSMLDGYAAEDARVAGRRIGEAFAQFCEEYEEGTPPAPPMPAQYAAHADAYEEGFTQGRDEYDPGDLHANCH